MLSKEQWRKIAIHCDSYNPMEKKLDMTSPVYEEKYESCENCSHFTEDKRCDLDLMDKVLSSLGMELDLKS
ncbi:MAG: hypothetical protein GXY88_02645 [Tissierellia bacterium]|nr:hypothetical protein [Tissierellia bacterium]